MPYKNPIKKLKHSRLWRKSHLKEMRAARMKSYYKNREKEIAKQIEYQKKNPKKYLEIVKRWQKNNPERTKEIQKKSYEKNKVKRIEASKEWSKKNRKKANLYHKKNRYRWIELVRHHNRLRKDKERGAIGKHTLREWQELCKKYNFLCVHCGRENIKLTRDHIIPITKGGSNDISNIQPLCGSCNSKKGNR